MSLDDEIRIRILDALGKKNSVIPNIRQIKRHTGYHKATIKSSLDFMQEQGLLTGFGPKIDLRKLGYKLEVLSIAQVDFSKKETFEKMLAMNLKDPHVYRTSSLIGPGNWNFIAKHIYKDIESYHTWVKENYYDTIPEIHDFVKDRQIFYEVEPQYKGASRTDSIIALIKQEKGFD